MGFCAASCMVKYGFRRDVYPNFFVWFSESENLDCQSDTDNSDYACIACFSSEKI